MFRWHDITNIQTGEILAQWFCVVYPSGPWMVADVCLDYELRGASALIRECPIKDYLLSREWRDYLLWTVVVYHGEGKSAFDVNNWTLTDLYLWRFIASRHPEWVPEWSPDWENVYAHCYAKKKEAFNGATARANGRNVLTPEIEQVTR